MKTVLEIAEIDSGFQARSKVLASDGGQAGAVDRVGTAGTIGEIRLEVAAPTADTLAETAAEHR